MATLGVDNFFREMSLISHIFSIVIPREQYNDANQQLRQN